MLHRLLPALNDCITAFDLDENRYLFISPNISTVLEREPEAIKANPDLWNEIIDEGDREDIIKRYKDQPLNSTIAASYRIKAPSGKTKWISEKRTVYRGENDHHVMLRTIAVADDHEKERVECGQETDFDILFNENPSPMWIYELATFGIVKVNASATRLYGYSEQEFLAMTIRDIRPESELERLNDYINHHVAGKIRQRTFNVVGVWKHQKKNKEILFVEITSCGISFENKECRLIIVINVTEKIHFQEERKRREQFLTSLIDSQTNFLIRIDPRGLYTFANKQFLKVFGYKSNELIGAHFSTTTLPAEEELCRNAFFECMNNPGVVVPLVHLKPDTWGNIHTTEWEFISIIDDGGQVTEIQGIGRDITNRIKNEQKIRQAQEEAMLTKNNLEALINNTDDHIWSVDSESRYVYMNDAYVRTVAFLTGVQPIAGTHSYLHAGYTQDTLDEWKEFYNRALAGERYTIRRESADPFTKKKIYFEVSFNPIYKINGEIIGVGCFAHNITAELEKEEALIEQNDRLRNIASLSSHELRRPVASLLGLLNLLDHENFSNPENRQIINHVGSVGKEIDQVIRLIVDKTFII